MKWQDFINLIKGMGFTGAADDLETVQTWLAKEGHNTDETVFDGEAVQLKTLFEGRPGKPLDASGSAAKREDEERFRAAVSAEVADVMKDLGLDRKPGKGTKIHDIKVGKDRLIDDPQGGFKSFGHFAMQVKDVAASGKISNDLDIWTKTLSSYGSENVGADGGFAVPPQWASDIRVMVEGEDSVLARCDQFPLTGNSIAFPTDETTPWQTSGGIQAYWEGEAGSITQSKPLLTTKELRLRKVTALIPVTDELLEDAAALGAYLTRKAGEKLDFKLGEAIFRGTGAGQPLGFLTGDGKVEADKVADQVADTIQANNIFSMYSRMYAPFRKDAVWWINQDLEPSLFTMALSSKTDAGTSQDGGGPIYIPPGGARDAPYATLLGKPVIATQHAATVGDVGDIVFASMKQYIAAVKSTGVEALSSIHLFFDQDVTCFKFRMRADGQPWRNTTISPRDGSNTMSAFITLGARA